jgi:hypothetical protein
LPDQDAWYAMWRLAAGTWSRALRPPPPGAYRRRDERRASITPEPLRPATRRSRRLRRLCALRLAVRRPSAHGDAGGATATISRGVSTTHADGRYVGRRPLQILSPAEVGSYPRGRLEVRRDRPCPLAALTSSPRPTARSWTERRPSRHPRGAPSRSARHLPRSFTPGAACPVRPAGRRRTRWPDSDGCAKGAERPTAPCAEVKYGTYMQRVVEGPRQPRHLGPVSAQDAPREPRPHGPTPAWRLPRHSIVVIHQGRVRGPPIRMAEAVGAG